MIRELMADWLMAKETEDAANAKRLAIEVDLYRAVMETVEIKKEGSTTYDDDGMKLTITSRMNISVDQEAAANFENLFVKKYEFSKTLAKGFSDAELETVQNLIVMKPAKPTFKVSVL